MWTMSPEMSVGHLLSLAPRGKEVIEIGRNISELAILSPSLLRESLESNNVRIKGVGIDFLISRLNFLEVESNDGSDVDSNLAYYSNPLRGEVFQVDYTGCGLSVEKLSEQYEFTCLQNIFFTKLKNKVEQDNIDWVHIFDSSDENNSVFIVTGLSEYMETNFWSIHASCVWTVEPIFEDKISLSGKISFGSHYYEECNFHFQADDIEIKRIEVQFDELFDKMKKLLTLLFLSK